MTIVLVIIVVLVIIYFIFIKPQKNSSQSNLSSNIGNGFKSEANKAVKDEQISFAESKTNIKHYFFFDCETTGLPIDRNADVKDFNNWPFPVQIAWLVMDSDFGVIESKSYILKQPTVIPQRASDIHGITTEKMNAEGVDPKVVYSEFIAAINGSTVSIAHNTDFDVPILRCDLLRNGYTKKVFVMKNLFCTMKNSTNLCLIPNSWGSYKWPRLEELYGFLFFNNTNIQIEGAHDALNDVIITAKCYQELFRKKYI